MKKGIALIAIAVIVVVVASRFRTATETNVTDTQFAGGSPRLAELLSDEGTDGYAEAIEPRAFAFPKDHGPHPDFRNEWWYVTGNLDGEKSERFGFELTIFRFSLTPPRQFERNGSAWKSNQVYIGHFAITDVENGNFHVAQRYGRGALGLAGAGAEPFRVWIEDWTIESEQSAWRLHARDGDIDIDLNLRPLKPPVPNGIDGLSQKSSEPGNASYYYSIPRIATNGDLKIGSAEFTVSGLSWLDREWSTSGLSPGQRGWDWFSIQLGDGSELMFYSLRKHDGSRDVHSAGTWVTAGGEGVHLHDDDVVISVEDYWESPAGGTYPMGWRLRVPRANLELTVSPVLDAQELRTIVRYWEGAVDVVGRKAGEPIDGRGYVELTGYARDDSR
jgi:predicted secreted hydrolase